MKIGVHLGNGNPRSGGEFTFQQEICNALIQVAPESDHEIVLFYGPNISASVRNVKNIQNILLNICLSKRIYYKVYRIFYNVVKSFIGQEFNVDRYLKAYSTDVKYILDSQVDMMWYVGPFCSTMEIPYFFTVLDLQHLIQPYFPEVSNEGVWDMRERVYSTQLRRASFIIVSTNIGKLEIEKFYHVPAERIFVLPYAAPQLEYASYVDNDVLIKYRIQPGYLFYPAQFWPQKNHVGLLRAVRLLRDRWNISLPVVFVGSDKGNLVYVKDWIIRLGLSQQVHILGFIPRKDLIALYRHALALTMPTMVGPDNIPSLEAFALHCPVITSNLPGFEEQLGDAALLVDPKDEEKIALAIKSVYEDYDLRQRLINRGLEKIAKWSWTDYVKGIFKILDEFEPIRRTWSRTGQYTLR